jgi:long-chain acyl-CoA synthetase
VLAEHPHVLDSVVIGVPSESGDGNIVKAYVVANSNCDDKELIGFCRARLANFKVPQSVEFLSEIPKNTLGKVIRKSEILEQYVYRNSSNPRVGSL